MNRQDPQRQTRSCPPTPAAPSPTADEHQQLIEDIAWLVWRKLRSQRPVPGGHRAATPSNDAVALPQTDRTDEG